MITALIMGSAVALATPSAEMAPFGLRVGPVGGAPTVSTGLVSIVGDDGGINAAHVAATYPTERWSVGVRLPFAAYRSPNGRSTGLGNLLVHGAAIVHTQGAVHAFGAEVHFNPGGHPYTWTHRAESLWPGTGVDAVWQFRTSGDIAWLARGSLGLHTAQAFEPFPGLFVRALAAGAVDVRITQELGFISEVSLAWWEVSPVELTAMVRGEPVAGLQLRGGLMLPVATWGGATPWSTTTGIRETTLLAALTLRS